MRVQRAKAGHLPGHPAPLTLKDIQRLSLCSTLCRTCRADGEAEGRLGPGRLRAASCKVKAAPRASSGSASCQASGPGAHPGKAGMLLRPQRQLQVGQQALGRRFGGAPQPGRHPPQLEAHLGVPAGGGRVEHLHAWPTWPGWKAGPARPPLAPTPPACALERGAARLERLVQLLGAVLHRLPLLLLALLGLSWGLV